MRLLFILLFSSLISFGQEDIERFKVYDTDNIYTSLLLDTATGQIWQLQIGLSKAGSKKDKDSVDQLKTVLSDTEYAYTEEKISEEYNKEYKYWEADVKNNSEYTAEEIEILKPKPLDERLKSGYTYWTPTKNGRFKLYPTDNTYNFIMVDVTDGRTWQVQWNIDEDKRLINSFY